MNEDRDPVVDDDVVGKAADENEEFEDTDESDEEDNDDEDVDEE